MEHDVMLLMLEVALCGISTVFALSVLTLIVIEVVKWMREHRNG